MTELLREIQGPCEEVAYYAAESLRRALLAQEVKLGNESFRTARREHVLAENAVKRSRDQGYELLLTLRSPAEVVAYTYSKVTKGLEHVPTPEQLRIRELYVLGDDCLMFYDASHTLIDVRSHDVDITPVMASPEAS